MAEFNGLSKAKAESIIGASVVSATINPSGHLIFTRNNGSTFDAGDFTAIVQDSFDAQIAAALLTAVPAAIVGPYVVKNNASGTISMAEFNKDNIVNVFLRVKATGNCVWNAADLPANCRPGTRFYFSFEQDAANGATVNAGGTGWSGGRQLTFNGFKNSQAQGPYQQPKGYDIYEILWDGYYWHVRKVFFDIVAP